MSQTYQFLRKYAQATTIDGVMLHTRGTADYKAGPTLATSDVKISKDGGAFADLGTLPSAAPAAGRALLVTLTGTEMTAAHLCIQFVDQTSPKEWEDCCILIDTYGHASAEHAFDLDTATQSVDATKIGGTTQTGRDLGASVLLASGTGTGQVDLSSGKVKIADGAIAAATFAAGAIDAAAIAADAIGASELAASAASEIADAVLGTSVPGAYGAGTAGKLIGDNLNATISSRSTLDAAGVRTAVGLASANLDTQLTAIDDYIDSEVAAIKAKTDNLPASPAAVSDIPTAAANADAVWDEARSGHTNSGTFGQRVVANADQIAGDGTAATNLYRAANGIVVGTASGTPTTTSIPASDLTSTTDDFYNGTTLVFVSGTLAGQRVSVTDYTGATKTLTTSASTSACSAGDKFVLV